MMKKSGGAVPVVSIYNIPFIKELCLLHEMKDNSEGGILPVITHVYLHC